jgi:hypothetical protein
VALDPSFSLSELSPQAGTPVSLREIPELADAIVRNSGRLWAFRVDHDCCELLTGTRLRGPGEAFRKLRLLLGARWLVLDHCTLNVLDRAIVSLQRLGGNGYSRLLEAGALALAPSPDCHLSGGSFADVHLSYVSGRLGVVKLISQPDQLNEVDAGRRLAREMNWLRNVPAGAAQLFPGVLETIETERAVGYVSQFVPGYTLAEQLLDFRLTFSAGQSALMFVLSALVERLYAAGSRPFLVRDIGSDYLRRIKRRISAINAAPPGTGELLKLLIRAESVMVNGIQCYGIPAILRALDGATLSKHLRVSGTELAHGDLILDDIIVTRHGNVCLVDPNGVAGSRLYDIGKLFLSLTSCYEFFKYDLFACEIEFERELPRITVTLPVHPALAIYAKLAEHLPEMLATCGVLADTEHQLTGTGLVLLNGLQNLGLPAFHLLRHRAEQRAVAFLALGLLRVTEGLRLVNAGRDVPLEHACRCMF